MKRIGTLWFLFPLAALGVAGSQVSAVGTPALPGDDVGERPLARAAHAMVAASNTHSAEAALEVLQQGGNAVDGAVAATLVAMVVEPNMASFGGFGSLAHFDAATGKSRFLTFWMQYPDRFDPDPLGGLGAYVIAPGAPRGLHQAVAKYGRLPFKAVAAPAIRIARDGFPVYGTLFGQMFERYAFLTATAEGRKTWTQQGFLPAPGSVFRQEALAETLGRYAAAGPDYVYRGAFAEKLVQAVSRYGGTLSLKDLDQYQVLDVELGSSHYRDYTIGSSWPPDSGGLGLALGLNLLEALDLPRSGHYATSVESAYYLYSTLETVNDLTQRFVRDPSVYEVPEALLLSKEFAAHQAQRIRDEKRLAEDSRLKRPRAETSAATAPARLPAPELETGTVHISVIDAQGNACGITSSIAGDTFGQSGIVVDGVLINGSGRFRPAGRKDRRWSSAAAPTLVLKDGRPVAVLGSPSDIYSTLLQVLLNLLDFGMDPQQAVSAPRMYVRRAQYRDSNAEYLVETRFEEAVLKGLKELDASVDSGGAYANAAGAARLVVRDPSSGELLGGVDPRRPGLAKGY